MTLHIPATAKSFAMAPLIPFTVLLLHALLSLLASAQDTALPPYSITDHPFSTLPQFASQASALASSATIVKGYHRHHDDNPRRDNREMLYVPRGASYVHFPSMAPFMTNADVLISANSRPGTVYSPYYMRFELHRQATVFVLMSVHHSHIAMVRDLDDFAIVETPEGWGKPFALRHDPSTSSFALSPEIKGMVHKYNPRVTTVAVAFKVPVGDDLTVTLPSPSSIKVNGVSFNRYFVLFAQPEETPPLPLPLPFPAPSLPDPFMSPVTGSLVTPANAVPVPNDYCPEWVHDLYVTPSRTGGAATLGEPAFWRTWHPLVDPVYWCYFDHEHGSYPGPTYRPQFGYTAWKTPDSSTTNGRQDESHNGFKIVAFTVPGDSLSRKVVTTVHMHLSKARRFTARHHTMIFAVLSASGELEAELHMKMDFGAAVAKLAGTRGVGPPLQGDGGLQQSIYDETGRVLRIVAHRRFNVVQMGSNFPETVNKSYGFGPLRDSTEKMNGLYELWRAPLNGCTGKKYGHSGFRYDIEKPATAINIPGATTDENIVWLKGSSMQKTLFIIPFTFAPEYCEFGGVSGVSGVFYTDSYFKEKHGGEGDFSTRQFIKEGFVPLNLPRYHYKLTNMWSGDYTCECTLQTRLHPINIDGAINKKVN